MNAKWTSCVALAVAACFACADTRANLRRAQSTESYTQSPSSSNAGKNPTPAAAQEPPADPVVMVWVNTASGVYHKRGSRYYGKTKQGKYMTEADAIKAGYHPAGKTSGKN